MVLLVQNVMFVLFGKYLIDKKADGAYNFYMSNLKFVHKLKKHKGSQVSAHRHDGVECVLYLKACGTTEIGGRQYPIEDGTVAIINAGTPHSEQHEGDGDIICLVSDFDAFHIRDGVYRPKNIADITRIALQILHESSSPKAFYNTVLSAKTDELMVCIMRDILAKGSSGELEACMQYITKNCLDDIDIKKMCAERSLGYESFRHRFKALYGMSPQNFLIYCRLCRAREMLGGDVTCTQIAHACGFCDSAQFCKMFKKQFGFTPTEFKKSIG